MNKHTKVITEGCKAFLLASFALASFASFAFDMTGVQKEDVPMENSVMRI